MRVEEREARGRKGGKLGAVEGPEEIASARLYAGPAGPLNDGEICARCLPGRLTEAEVLRKAKRLRVAFMMSASGMSTWSIGTTRWIISAAI